MQKSLFYLLIALLMCPAGMSLAQDISTDPRFLAGGWKINMELQLPAVRSENSAVTKKYPEERWDDLYNTLESRIYLFSEDGSFRATWVAGGQFSSVSGSWKYGENGILTISTVGNEISYRVVLQDGNMSWIPLQRTSGIVHQIHLNRI
ncbi:hypothetical protein [Aquiflexum sp.]|uniref:hypothetical protein n=1 Tax=Aquiflexum sp. TaxID=1872584 RepID=UPI0035933E6A